MRIDDGIAGAFRRLIRWTRTGDGARQPARQIGSPAPSSNESFVADLDEAQRRAVLGAIFAARRPLSSSAGLD